MGGMGGGVIRGNKGSRGDKWKMGGRHPAAIGSTSTWSRLVETNSACKGLQRVVPQLRASQSHDALPSLETPVPPCPEPSGRVALIMRVQPYCARTNLFCLAMPLLLPFGLIKFRMVLWGFLSGCTFLSPKIRVRGGKYLCLLAPGVSGTDLRKLRQHCLQTFSRVCFRCLTPSSIDSSESRS